MPDKTLYEILDTIADSYIPFLLIISLALCAFRFRHSHFRHPHPAAYGLRLFLYALCVYGSQWLDKALNLWPTAGLDYSTHTTAALALTCLLVQQCAHMVARASSLAVFLAYLILMKIQNYHSFADMFTSAICVGAEILLIEAFLTHLSNKSLKLHILKIRPL